MRSARRVLIVASLAVAVTSGLAAPATAGSEEDLRALASTIYHEARGRGRQAMLAVGWLALNRVRDPAFPSTVRAVVYQRRGPSCEFGRLCHEPVAQPRDRRSWALALRVARELLSASPPPDPTRGGLWMHEHWREPPEWTRRLVRTAIIGGNVFYARR